jgi:sporulation protein YlmC with PRC-barrel domain
MRWSSGGLVNMAQCGLLRNYRFTNDAEDIRGSRLYDLYDEKLGKIEDVIFEHATGNIRYVVVDTGGWLCTKKFIVPADRIVGSVEHKDDFAVNLTKPQIESMLPYKESDLESDELWADYEGRYRAQWKTDPIMHRAETDRNITPTTYQEVRKISSERASDNLPVTEGFAASTDTVEIDNSAVGIGSRWDTFRERLRARRKEAIGISSECR